HAAEQLGLGPVLGGGKGGGGVLQCHDLRVLVSSVETPLSSHRARAPKPCGRGRSRPSDARGPACVRNARRGCYADPSAPVLRCYASARARNPAGAAVSSSPCLIDRSPSFSFSLRAAAPPLAPRRRTTWSPWKRCGSSRREKAASSCSTAT